MQTPAQRVPVDVQFVDDLAVDLDHGDPLEVGGEEPFVGLDVDLAQLDPAQLVGEREQLAARLVAQMTIRAAIEGDDHAASTAADLRFALSGSAIAIMPRRPTRGTGGTGSGRRTGR